MNTDIKSENAKKLKSEKQSENEKKSENREKVKIMMYANFGEFISRKRVEKKITLRKMADMLGVSYSRVQELKSNSYRKLRHNKKIKAVWATEFLYR